MDGYSQKEGHDSPLSAKTREQTLQSDLIIPLPSSIDQHTKRFSEDIDFTSLDMDITIEEMIDAFERYDFFTVKKQFTSAATIKLTRLQYAGILAQPNHIKIEIDHRQNVVLPPQRRPYENAWGLDETILEMICRFDFAPIT